LAPLKIKRIIDLSQTLYNEMPAWQTNPDLKYEPKSRAARDFFNVTVINQMTVHTGAHVDVPLHSIQEGKTIDQYKIEHYTGEGVVLDLTSKGPGEEITRQDLESFTQEIKEDDFVMLCTNWSRKRGYNSEYLYKWPFPNLEACSFLIEKKIKAVGTEGLSIAGWTDHVPVQGPVTKLSSADIHNSLLREDILIVEGLANLSDILEDKKSARAYFICAPLNLVGAEGSPCRALALLGD
jgi:arylformamidase